MTLMTFHSTNSKRKLIESFAIPNIRLTKKGNLLKSEDGQEIKIDLWMTVASSNWG